MYCSYDRVFKADGSYHFYDQKLGRGCKDISHVVCRSEGGMWDPRVWEPVSDSTDVFKGKRIIVT